MSLADRTVLVSGGTGFFGRHIVEVLQGRGARVRAVGSRDCDLKNADAVANLLYQVQPELVVHAAGTVGGIAANRAAPGQYLYENALMGLNLIEQCRVAQVSKMVVLGTVCSYPKFAPVPMREDTLWDGYPEETNAPYGIAKKMLLVQCQAYRQQYGFNAVYLMPVNLYGPGDNFHPTTSHVIPALIRKCLEAKDQGRRSIHVWGTGRASREFLFVKDAAEAVALAAERYDGELPVNLPGCGEVSIADLVGIIAAEVGFEGEIEWDASMPDGQPRRGMDPIRARDLLGFVPRTPLAQGMHETVQWYMRQVAAI
ncbi:MAG: GDP-L-fucose synthase family protein [Candidatus Xenobia bacterium]